jgi:integrase
MRAQVDRHTFDATQWVPAKLKEFKFENEAARWIDATEQDHSWNYTKQVKSIFKNHLLPEYQGKDVRDIRASHLEATYRRLLSEGYAVSTVNLKMRVFYAFMKTLEELGVIERTPRLPRIKVPRTDRGWISRANQEAILARIPAHQRLIYETLMETAIRPNEVCGLKVRDLNEDGELIIQRSIDERGNVNQTKTGVVYYKVLSPVFYANLLKQTKNKLPEAWIFTSRTGSPYRPGQLSKIWRDAAKEAGISVCLYVGTKHSHASQKRLRLEKGIGEDLRKELGHATSKTTLKHYARGREEEVTPVSVECPWTEKGPSEEN